MGALSFSATPEPLYRVDPIGLLRGSADHGSWCATARCRSLSNRSFEPRLDKPLGCGIFARRHRASSRCCCRVDSDGASFKARWYAVRDDAGISVVWSIHDNFAHHQRRYVRKDFELLAQKTGLKFIDARYFMFFLSPLYILTRSKARLDQLSEDEKKRSLSSSMQFLQLALTPL